MPRVKEDPPSPGTVFNDWTVLEGTERRECGRRRRNKLFLECQCTCGTIAFVYIYSLKKGTSKGCKYCGWERQKILSYFTQERESKNFQGRSINEYLGNDGTWYTVPQAAKRKRMTADTIYKRIKLYSFASKLVLKKGRVLKDKNISKEVKKKKKIDKGELKLKQMATPTHFDNLFTPDREPKVFDHSRLFAEHRKQRRKESNLNKTRIGRKEIKILQEFNAKHSHIPLNFIPNNLD